MGIVSRQNARPPTRMKGRSDERLPARMKGRSDERLPARMKEAARPLAMNACPLG